jgi:hypothetical protein
MSEQAATTTTPPETKQKHRSPSYPAIDLKTAVGRAAEIQKMAGNHPAPYGAVIKAWGYGPKSSNGILTVAALKKYALATDTGRAEARKIQLTRLGSEILFFNEGSDEWLQRARTAALTPKIYRTLWQSYGPDLPADTVMLYDLTFEKRFGEAAARDVIRLFRATVAYVNLAEADGMLDVDDADEESGEDTEQEQILTPPSSLTPSPQVQTHSPEPGQSGSVKRATSTVQLTYAPTEWALLQAKFPMSEQDWDAMIAVLEAMKRGLVVSEPETGVPTSRTTVWNADEVPEALESTDEPAAPSEDR